jgi:hypothetical protein
VRPGFNNGMSAWPSACEIITRVCHQPAITAPLVPWTAAGSWSARSGPNHLAKLNAQARLSLGHLSSDCCRPRVSVRPFRDSQQVRSIFPLARYIPTRASARAGRDQASSRRVPLDPISSAALRHRLGSEPAGRADRTARKVAKAAQVAREELAELSKRVDELARDLKRARSRLKQALRWTSSFQVPL